VAATRPTKPPSPSQTPAKPSNGGLRDDRELTGYAAIPFSFGHGAYKSSSGSASGLWLRLRGVVAIGKEDTFRRRGWALGPYFEVAWHPVTGQDRMASFGAGATGIWAITRGFGVIPSVGWYSQQYPGSKTEHGVSGGLFVGAIQDTFGPFLLPIGVRIETRAGFGDQSERSMLFGGEVDSVIGAAIPVFIIMWAGSSYNWT
jgi:hypothetical protein